MNHRLLVSAGCAFSILALSGCTQSQEKRVNDAQAPEVETTKLALAKPIDNIIIDGDVSDWGADDESFPIAAILEGGPQSASDLQAHFRVGYSQERNSVFFAVVVQDDRHMLDPQADGLTDEQDQLLVYIDKDHDPKGSGVRVLSYNEHHQEYDDVSTSWDPAVREKDNSDIKTAIARKSGLTIYEGEISFNSALKAGDAIGLDFMLYDADGDGAGTTRISWRDTDGKTNVPFRLGHVFLIDENTAPGRLNGTLKWAGEPLGGPINTVRISSVDHTDMWVRDDVDDEGHYSITLPEGEYKVSAEWGIYNGGEIQYKVIKNAVSAAVTPDTTTTAETLMVDVAEAPRLIPEQGVLLALPADRYEQLDAFVTGYMKHYDIPGVSLAIIEDGALAYHKTYGVSNTYSGEPVTSETIFEAASITKPVFAFAVMRLAERGVINLDTPLYEYLPFDAIAHDERYKLITARHVLSHKTGFPNWRSGDMTIEFTPGTRFGYSGEGFQYLQRVVEKITGKDIVQILDEEVLTPLALEDIYFEKSDHLFNVVAHGHDDFYPHKVSLPGNAGMAWSMHTEARAFSDFAIALMERRGLSAESYEDMFNHHTVTDKYENFDIDGWASFFGLGVQIEQTPFGAAIGHGGNNGDFKCEFKIFPVHRLGFIVFTNGNTGNELTDSALERFLVLGQQQR